MGRWMLAHDLLQVYTLETPDDIMGSFSSEPFPSNSQGSHFQLFMIEEHF